MSVPSAGEKTQVERPRTTRGISPRMGNQLTTLTTNMNAVNVPRNFNFLNESLFPLRRIYAAVIAMEDQARSFRTQTVTAKTRAVVDGHTHTSSPRRQSFSL